MIELRGVKKYYGRNSTGLMKESVVINTGEVVGILGENGSGKTTLLKAIMGLCELTEGEILIDGKPVHRMYDRLAFITEEGSFFPDMKPLEYGEFLSEFVPGFDMERYRKLLNFFDLDITKKIKSFSHGQKSKLEVSAGFSRGAEYILMDEPFSGNDVFTRRDFLKLMVSSLKDRETIIIATHLIDEIENFIDRAIILRYGRIKADFQIDEMRGQGKDLRAVMMGITGYEEDNYKKFI
jgi:ABC-2 type transport system ATP-binding protein